MHYHQPSEISKLKQVTPTLSRMVKTKKTGNYQLEVGA